MGQRLSKSSTNQVSKVDEKINWASGTFKSLPPNGQVAFIAFVAENMGKKNAKRVEFYYNCPRQILQTSDDKADTSIVTFIDTFLIKDPIKDSKADPKFNKDIKEKAGEVENYFKEIRNSIEPDLHDYFKEFVESLSID